MGLAEIRAIKEAAKNPKPKKTYTIPSKSAKKIAQEKEENGEDAKLKEAWFQARRKNLVGVCQCGCGEPSQKKDDTYFRHSIAHIFPKSKFESVKYHKINFVERAFFGGCHGVMDDTSMDKWPNMADWEDIKMKFHVLAPLLSDEEKATKFYTKLESLVNNN
jgi:hypothetical protein